MAADSNRDGTKTLDKDLEKIAHVEEATAFLARSFVGPGLGLVFLGLCAIVASLFVLGEPYAVIVIVAAAIGGYMAINIGANDVANNVGPAVGARALTIGGALALAAVFESAGALIAGRDVVTTISSGIVPAPSTGDGGLVVRLMLAALMSAALWINVATWISAPVSTTHSIVGAVIGAGISATGFASVDWEAVAVISVGWVASPVLGALLAVACLAFIKTVIIYRDDKIAAARFWVPVLIGVMAGAFAAYLGVKALENVVRFSWPQIAALGAGSFAVAWLWSGRVIARLSLGMENSNRSLRSLFAVPLIGSAALLSFGHGANDVSNVVGPLAAIVHAASGATSVTIAIPLWVMMIGAFGISAGVVLFGPKLVRMVGERITRLNPIRAFCVALSSAVTVIVASWFGFPVSSTHVALGAIFGVGFFREWYIANSTQRRAYIERRKRKIRAAASENGKAPAGPSPMRRDRPPVSREEVRRRKLVRRAHVTTIVTAWVTTVPASALLAALLFQLLDSLV